MKRSGVYQIINEINGDYYIGSSKDIRSRWRDWKRHFKKPMTYVSLLWKAVQKYGIENFTFIVLEECEPTKEQLESRENYYLETLKPKYNIIKQAYVNGIANRSATGKTHTEEWKQNMSIRASEYMSDPIIKQKYRDLRQGKTFEEIFGERREEIREKQSRGRKGKRVGIPSWNKGIPMTNEQKQKLIEANIGREPWNKGTTGLMPAPWNKGKEMSDECKQKNSEAHLGKEPWNKGQKGLQEAWNRNLVNKDTGEVGISLYTYRYNGQEKQQYQVRLLVDGKRKYFGRFATLEEARTKRESIG